MVFQTDKLTKITIQMGTNTTTTITMEEDNIPTEPIWTKTTKQVNSYKRIVSWINWLLEYFTSGSNVYSRNQQGQ